MAGAIAHGSGLAGSVMRHYVSPLQVLAAAMPRVKVPAAMRGTVQIDDEQTLLSNFRRLDPEAQRMITGMSERLAVS